MTTDDFSDWDNPSLSQRVFLKPTRVPLLTDLLISLCQWKFPLSKQVPSLGMILDPLISQP